MIVTQQTPKILFELKDFYQNANKKGKAYEMISKAIFHNNEPVNILVAVTCLKDVECMVRIDRCHPVELEYCLRYFSEVTGYSARELQERLEF